MRLLNWLKRCWPDIIILLALAVWLLVEYRVPLEDWQFIDGKMVGKFKGYIYRWEKIIPLWVMIFGLDALIRSLISYRRKRFELGNK